MAAVNVRPGAQAPAAYMQIHFTSEEFAAVQDQERAHLDIPAQETELYGLALSGGGIRSASFALGVLQALHGYNVFNRFHYLSTVSGGGYIGSALTYFRNVFSGFGQTWFPFGYLTSGSNVRAIGARTPKPAARRARMVSKRDASRELNGIGIRIGLSLTRARGPRCA